MKRSSIVIKRKEAEIFQENLKTVKHYYRTNWVYLSKKLKQDRVHLSVVERKRQFPYESEVRAVAKLLNVSPEKLLTTKLVLKLEFEKKKIGKAKK